MVLKCDWCLGSGKLWCAKKNKRKRKKLLYNAHRNDGTTYLYFITLCHHFLCVIKTKWSMHFLDEARLQR